MTHVMAKVGSARGVPASDSDEGAERTGGSTCVMNIMYIGYTLYMILVVNKDGSAQRVPASDSQIRSERTFVPTAL